MNAFENNMLQKMHLSSRENNKVMDTNSFLLCGDRYQQIQSLSCDNCILGIVSRKRKIYFQAISNGGDLKYHELESATGKGQSFPECRDIFHSFAFYDSVTLSYPKPGHLKFCQKTIKTETLHSRYRVAHHLGRKVYFIAFVEYGDRGALHAADVGGAEEVVISHKLNKDSIFKDVLVDQYTGDIILADSYSNIWTLQRLHYFTELDALLNKDDALLPD